MESKYSYPAQTTCDKCGDDVRRFKFLQKVNGGRFCKKCVREKRKDLEKEWAEKRKEKEKLMKTLPNYESPGIKSIRRGRPKISSLGIYITRDEKNVLYKKLVGLGFDSKTANERIDNLCEKMRKVVEKLRETVKSEEDLNKRFREEFGKMCMELESGGLE